MNNLSHFDNQPRSATDTSAITALCKAAGDPLRMQVLKVLQQNAYGVLELCQVFDIRQSAMSHHLKDSRQCWPGGNTREGTTIFYRRNESHPDTDLQPLQQCCSKPLMMRHWIQPCAHVWNRSIRSVRRRRWRSSTTTQRGLRRIRILIASWSDYGDSVESFLESSIANRNSALEIGPGYGQFLPSYRALSAR